jgi:hypothetical protein
MQIGAEVVINAPAEDASAVIGERFGEIAEWAPAITDSVMDGPPAAGRVRTCQVAGFGPIAAGVITERLTEFDPQARSLSYEAAAGCHGSLRAPSAAGRYTRGQAVHARSGSAPRWHCAGLSGR